MNTKFILRLQNFIDYRNKKLEEYIKDTPSWKEMNEEQKFEAISREIEISTLKMVRDWYLDCIKENEKTTNNKTP